MLDVLPVVWRASVLGPLIPAVNTDLEVVGVVPAVPDPGKALKLEVVLRAGGGRERLLDPALGAVVA